MAWETLNKTWKERVDRLEEAMQAAVQFQDGLQVVCHRMTFSTTATHQSNKNLHLARPNIHPCTGSATITTSRRVTLIQHISVTEVAFNRLVLVCVVFIYVSLSEICS